MVSWMLSDEDDDDDDDDCLLAQRAGTLAPAADRHPSLFSSPGTNDATVFASR